VGDAWLSGLTSGHHLLAGGLGCLLLVLVGLDAVQEVQSALGVLDVLNTDVDPLGKDLSADALVDDDADGVLGHVEDATGLAVVSLVGHTLLEGTVTLDVNNVSHLVAGKVGGQVLDSLGLVLPREHVSGATAVTLGIRHLGAVWWWPAVR